VFLILVVAYVEATNIDKPPSEMSVLCSQPWEQFIEENVPTGDGSGHGPDLGSDEWKSVVEFKLGIQDKPGVPEQDTESWCRYIDQIARSNHAPSVVTGDFSTVATKTVPSFACDEVEAGSIEAMICEEEELSVLDRKLSSIYTDAARLAANEHPPLLKADQRRWIKGRNECCKSAYKRKCVRVNYLNRIVELQARYRLVANSGPVTCICNGNRADEVIATFFQTDPPTLIAERGDSVSLMYLQPRGGEASTKNETLWKHGDTAVITWGYGAEELHCKKTPL